MSYVLLQRLLDPFDDQLTLMRRRVYNHDAIVKLADCLSVSWSIIEDEMI